MNQASHKKLVKELAEEIQKHKDLYYKGTPIISDEDFDLLEENLRDLEPDHPILSQVGSKLRDLSQKIQHKIPMLSLAKTYELKDLRNWMDDKALVGTYKIDGNCLSLIYESGQLVQAKTRGDGFWGEDVLRPVLFVPGCLKNISDKKSQSLEIRGELYCTEKSFKLLVNEMNRLKLSPPSNRRNIIAGILGRKKHLELSRFFNFFAFDVFSLKEDEDLFETEIEKFEFLKKLAFDVPFYTELRSFNQVENYLTCVQKAMEEQDIGIDGAVFTFNELLLHKQLGVTAHHPRFKLAYKWQGDTAVATIEGIKWATSRFGVITPIAQIKPVELSGAIITNVTLHNAAYVKEFKLKKGDKIQIVRSGEVIPKFLKVLESSDGDVSFPHVCPSCFGRLHWDNIRLMCGNNLCIAQKIRTILNWIQCAEIDDLSNQRLALLVDFDLVKEIPDLYTLREEDLLKLPMTKEKMAKKLVTNIQKSKQLGLVSFLCGLGIKTGGKSTWQLICEEFETLEKIRQLTLQDLISLKGFAEKTAKEITDGLATHKELIDKLLALGFDPQFIKQNSKNLLFKGKSFVITGTLSRPRKEIEDIIKTLGGSVISTVSKNTTALIIDDSTSNSSKAIKARQLQIPMISEAEFELWIADGKV